MITRRKLLQAGAAALAFFGLGRAQGESQTEWTFVKANGIDEPGVLAFTTPAYHVFDDGCTESLVHTRLTRPDQRDPLFVVHRRAGTPPVLDDELAGQIYYLLNDIGLEQVGSKCPQVDFLLGGPKVVGFATPRIVEAQNLFAGLYGYEAARKIVFHAPYMAIEMVAAMGTTFPDAPAAPDKKEALFDRKHGILMIRDWKNKRVAFSLAKPSWVIYGQNPPKNAWKPKMVRTPAAEVEKKFNLPPGYLTSRAKPT